jgi:hypothetical protein
MTACGLERHPQHPPPEEPSATKAWDARFEAEATVKPAAARSLGDQRRPAQTIAPASWASSIRTIASATSGSGGRLTSDEPVVTNAIVSFGQRARDSLAM